VTWWDVLLEEFLTIPYTKKATPESGFVFAVCGAEVQARLHTSQASALPLTYILVPGACFSALTST
jgi:hypothetical protein